MATPAPHPAAAETDRLHPMVDVFFSPVSTMDYLARNPGFLPALILITVIGAITMAIAFQRGVIEHGIRHKVETNSRIEQLPTEERERVVAQFTRMGSYVALAGAVVGPAAGLLVASGILLLIAHVMGARVRFRQMMAVVAHAWLPLALASLIAIPILLAKDADAIDFQNIVTLANLGFLFSPTEQHRLYMVASSIDLFSLWVIALLTLGMARLTGKGAAASLGIILAPWALYVVIFKAILG